MSLYVDAHVAIPAPRAGESFSLDVDFTVDDGEILGLLGPSGSGKSMTLKSIAGIVKPDSGRIVLNGTVLFDSETNISMPTRSRKVGYLFQSYALFPHMTVSQNIACGFQRLVGESWHVFGKRVETVRQQYLELLHIGQHANSYPRFLSGGQQQRVALARLLASHPSAILLDEPFSALDNELKQAIDADMKTTLLSANCPVIFVSHNEAEVNRYCCRILRIDHGKL